MYTVDLYRRVRRAHYIDGKSERKPDEEQANAYLFAASKEAVRALLALVDSRALSRVEFEAKWGADFDAWKNAAEVIGKAKG